MKKLVDRPRPRGWLRWFLRAPLWLYELHLGWLLGQRFLRLTHVGRKSGLPRQTVLEVVNRDPAEGTYTVASGWGETSDWLRNVQKTPEVRVSVGRRSFDARAERLSREDGVRALHSYARRHPGAFRALAKAMMGEPLSGTEEDCRKVAKSVPVVALRPRD